jgi:hypothetical protein
MKFAKLLTGLILGGGTLMAGAATLSNIGAAQLNEPQGISIRQESQRSQGRGFFYGYGRSHRGGGLGGGK